MGTVHRFRMRPLQPRWRWRTTPPPRLSTGRLIGICLGGGLAVFLFLVWLRSFGFSSELIALRHVAAGFGCETAYSVGLTPARRGEPGYWRRLDADDDGISCEIYTPGDLRRYRAYRARHPMPIVVPFFLP